MNEAMAPGENEVTEGDEAMLEQEMAADDEQPYLADAIADDEVEIESLAIDGVDVPIDQVMAAYRGDRGAQQEAQRQSRERKQLNQVAYESTNEVSEAPDPTTEADNSQVLAPQSEADQPQNLPQELRVEEYLLLNEVEGLKKTYGEFDEDAVFETMVSRGIDDVETALFVARGQAASRSDGQDAANAAADGVVNSAGAEGPSSSSIVSTETPNVEGKSWGQIEREAASDVSRRGASILS